MPENQAMFDDGRRTTYAATTHERAWLRSSLQEFYDDQWFTDVLYMAKGGKEATVYCCRAQPEAGMPLVAAKVFRPTMFRAMRNDWFYKQGRTAVGVHDRSCGHPTS
jgi:RIO kinase 1